MRWRDMDPLKIGCYKVMHFERSRRAGRKTGVLVLHSVVGQVKLALCWVLRVKSILSLENT